jgi:hypothetical protein
MSTLAKDRVFVRFPAAERRPARVGELLEP